jgi:hypothetical protein
VLAVSEDVLAVAAGEAAATAGVTTASEGVVTGAAGAAPGAAGMLAVSEGVLTGAVGGAAGAAGMLAVSEGVLTGAVDAAAGAQRSEIMFSSVTSRLSPAAPELATLALCPMRVTSWPRCALRSTLLVVILKMWPVLSSATV